MKRELRRLALLLVVCAGGIGSVPHADAQVPAATSQAPSPESMSSPQAARDLDYLISILQDDARRQALLAELKARQNIGNATASQAPAPTTEPAQAQAAPSPAAETVVVTLSEHVREFSERALRLAIGKAPGDCRL